MHIDLHNTAGDITSYRQARSENADGETARAQVDLGLRVMADRSFLDLYLEGHNTGAQPSLVFWRADPAIDSDPSAYVRYLGIDKIQLSVPEKPQYTLKLQERPRVGQLDLNALRQFLIADVQVKKVTVQLTANGCVVDFKLRFSPRTEWVRDLTDLQLQESVDIWLFNTNPDLFAKVQPPPREPAAPEDDEDEEGEDEGDTEGDAADPASLE